MTRQKFQRRCCNVINGLLINGDSYRVSIASTITLGLHAPPVIKEFMNLASIRKDAFAVPVHNPAYPRPPYRFINREYFVISYETDFDALRAIVPEPLHPENDLVHYEFIRMPDSSGFGDYTESGQVISVVFRRSRSMASTTGTAAWFPTHR
jgi:Acetoacetate decarboxylase (ADC)